ncbi:hypothetical protein TL16_g09116 [Triparma laevis f. inornata]|uniref:Uncharacterized protein n=1 Tax=Triparma laevis f. inornata TaxID=1714386 RepID=A0A9W7B1A3_9STRA|nr:hypothetical protein TL16_g09116 [Triparma laevis f. inornata]
MKRLFNTTINAHSWRDEDYATDYPRNLRADFKREFEYFRQVPGEGGTKKELRNCQYKLEDYNPRTNNY